jgi:predicted Zn-dependent protease
MTSMTAEFGQSPSSKRASTPVRLLGAMLAVTLAVAPAQAQMPHGGPGFNMPGVVRDAETEQLLRDYATPIFKAAGVNGGATKIILIGDRSFNAFVANGRKIFVNLGAMMESKTPNEMIGILAHETGHIAGGHLANLHQELARAQIIGIVGMLVGAGGMIATARSSRPGSPVGMDGNAPIGMVMGPAEIARRTMLSYVRSQEEAADRAAVKYLEATGQSAKGLLTTLSRFENESLFKTNGVDPYTLSHPLPRERISNLETLAKASSSFSKTDPASLQARHDLVRAKIVGFVGNAGEIARRYPVSDTSLAAKYARAVSAHRFGRTTDAQAQIDALIAAQPNNPYFHELKGQALLESGRAREAVPHLRKAASMVPSALPIKVMLGHALVASEQADDAIKLLSQVTQSDPEDSEAFQYLSMAYYKKGNTAQAQLAAAQGLFLTGRYVEARTQADRAKRQFPQGSPGWLKADDILNWRPPKS